MTDGPAHDLAQYISAALIGGNHAVGDEERGCAGVVGNHAERRGTSFGFFSSLFSLELDATKLGGAF